MKKILFLLLVVFIFASCGKKTPRTLDPNATINIREAKQLRSAPHADQETPTWEWVVNNASGMEFKNLNEDMPMGLFTRGIAPAQRDTENLLIKMWGTDVIGIRSGGDTYLETMFLDAYDVIFVAPGNDTVAYIPNATIRDAAIQVRAAYAAENYTEVYRLFDDAYRAIPITGKDYKALTEQGRQ